MRATQLNLAERPFVNERPVKRTTLLLWGLGLVLVIFNVVLYQRHLSGQHEQRETMDALAQGIAEERDMVENLEQQLDKLELAQQNRQVVYLNAQISKRTFSWSRLFDRLAEVLPESVQLRKISPRIVSAEDTQVALVGKRVGDVVKIQISGIAQSEQAVLELVDGFFAHPSFVAPDLSSESEKQEKRHEFAMTVLYLPAEIQDGSQADPTGGEK